MRSMTTSALKIRVLLLDPDDDDSLMLEVGGLAADMRHAIVMLPELVTVFDRAMRDTLEADVAERARNN